MALWKSWLDPESTSYVAVVSDRDESERNPDDRIVELRLELHDGGCNNAVCVSLFPTGGKQDLLPALAAIGALEEAVALLRAEAVKMAEGWD